MAKNSKRHKKRSLIEPSAVGLADINSKNRILKGIQLPKLDQEKSVSVSLKYFHRNYQCFSKWQVQELKAFSSFIEKLRNADWGRVVSTGGSPGNKTGLGYTKHKCSTARKKFLWDISSDIEFCELRVNQRARIHGFHIDSVFYLCWLDKDHKFL